VDRERDLRESAQRAVAQVQSTGIPYAFPPMTSRERRMLHLALEGCGLSTASSGENPRRFVVLYPSTASEPPNQPPAAERFHHLRTAFRPR
jgi:spoIIIJ-associated protein